MRSAKNIIMLIVIVRFEQKYNLTKFNNFIPFSSLYLNYKNTGI